MLVEDWTDLAAIIAREKAAGKVVVTTNGVFDLPHVGHLRYLKQARALGDLLVIGLNSDAGTKRLKGQFRPIVPENERAELLLGLSCVDFVTYFDETNPCELLAILKPTIHTKGGDYDPETMPETPIVRANGGEIVILPFVMGLSSTETIARVIEMHDLECKLKK